MTAGQTYPFRLGAFLRVRTITVALLSYHPTGQVINVLTRLQVTHILRPLFRSIPRTNQATDEAPDIHILDLLEPTPDRRRKSAFCLPKHQAVIPHRVLLLHLPHTVRGHIVQGHFPGPQLILTTSQRTFPLLLPSPGLLLIHLQQIFFPMAHYRILRRDRALGMEVTLRADLRNILIDTQATRFHLPLSMLPLPKVIERHIMRLPPFCTTTHSGDQTG
jgi:hypothetical protein